MLTNINNLNRNTDLLDYQTALGTIGKEQALATTTLDTAQKLATAPYSYRVQGPAGVLSSAPAASQAAQSLLGTYADQAGSAFGAAGQAADKLIKETGIGDMTFGDLFAPTPASNPIDYSSLGPDPMYGGSFTAGSTPNAFQTNKTFSTYL